MKRFECQCTDDKIMEMKNQGWRLYFGGDANKNVFRVVILMISPKVSHTSISIKLNFEATNNIVE